MDSKTLSLCCNDTCLHCMSLTGGGGGFKIAHPQVLAILKLGLRVGEGVHYKWQMVT